MTVAIYLVGAPGVGKSAVMGELLAGWTLGEYVRLAHRELFATEMEHEILGPGLHLGRRREEFPGTDSLSLTVQPIAVEWAAGYDGSASVLLGEGSRLTFRDFFVALASTTDLTVVNLEADFEVAQQRREDRPRVKGRRRPAGSLQSPAFVKGSTTRARNAIEKSAAAGVNVRTIDTTHINAAEVAEEILSWNAV